MKGSDHAQRRRRPPIVRGGQSPGQAADPAGGTLAARMLEFQQQAGNRALSRSVQRQTAGTVAVDGTVDAAPAGPNPLVGLKKGDGLNFGTNELRPRVELLQRRLNENTAHVLAEDGMWGNKTSAALKEFHLGRSEVPREHVDQPTGDALMGKQTEPPEPKPPGPTPGPPGTAPFNPHVEGRLEAVLEEYRIIFSLQKDALRRLESDLAEIEDAEPGFVEGLMLKAVDAIMEQFIGLTFRDLKLAVTELGLELTPEQHAATTDEAQAKLVEVAQGTMQESLARKSPGIDDVAAFVESQLDGATDAAAELHSNFLIKTKPAMSKLNPGEVATEDESDPRVARADRLRLKVRQGRSGAFEYQYGSALSRWTAYLAQKKVKASGQTPTVTGGLLDPDREGTNMANGDSTSGAAGVLQLTFTATAPNKPVKLDSVEIVGLSAKVRDRLNKGDHTLGVLSFPVRAEGDLTEGEFLGIDFDPADVVMSRNEAERDFLNDDGGDDGRAWLTAKSAHERGLLPPDNPGVASPQDGARIVLNELLAKRTSKHPIDRG